MLLSEDVVFSPMEEEVLVFGKVADVGRKDGACASWSWLRCFTNSCGYEPRMVYCVFGWVGGNVCVLCDVLAMLLRLGCWHSECGKAKVNVGLVGPRWGRGAGNRCSPHSDCTVLVKVHRPKV